MIKDIKPSKEFKVQTTKAVFAIILFSIVYLLLFLGALGLTALCVYGGYKLITNFPRIITIILGLGLAGMGVLILLFLLKFIFKTNKIDRSHLIEIKKEDEPRVFQMIENIVKEVGTSFPKKVYLSADVNASVFYDSTFWSMFFPIKKNLVIGVGLVNTITHEELKAVLAHEFGHFSQKTMKVGSYVYNVNQVIYNLLYENEDYDNMVQSWANVNGYLAIFAIIAMKVVHGIQWVLKKMYDVVNKSYMALSREMEFHADEIAAHVTGYPPLKSALLRMQLADHSYSNVLSFYEEKVKDNRYSPNVYREQSFIMNTLAKNSNLAVKNDFPIVTLEELNKYNKSKLVIKDQWASHPTLEDRIARLEKTNIILEGGENKPANSIFVDYTKTQKTLTKHLFKNVSFQSQESVSAMPFDVFKSEYDSNIKTNSFPGIYNGYYDNKNPIKFALEEVFANCNDTNLDNLYSEEKLNLLYQEISLANDIQLLELVADGTYSLKTFDYDGKKYRKKHAKELLTKLKSELQELGKAIAENDKSVYCFFKKKERVKGDDRLDSLYRAFFSFESDLESKFELYTEMQQKLQFIAVTTPIEEIQRNFSHVASLEKRLKREIELILQNPLYKEELTSSIKESFETYLSKDWQYFGKQTYFDHNLNILFEALSNYSYLLSRGLFIQKKKLLDYQASLI